MTADERPPLDQRALRDRVLGPGSPWGRIDVVAQTASTNADLIARATGGMDVDGMVLFAEHQTAGRGRNGRSWSTVPRAQITMSVGVNAAGVGSESWGWVPLATGVAVVDAVAEVTGVRSGLKWPNDVIAGEGKLAGILAEVAAPAPVIVIGLGLNVSLRAHELPDPAATSLSLLGAARSDRMELACALLRELAFRLARWREAIGADPGLLEDYRARSLTIGSRVRAVLPGGRDIVGVARTVDAQGRLCLDADGGTVRVSAGDVVHLRPAGDTAPR